MRFDVVTLFPELFAAFLELALVGKAARAGTIRVRLQSPRDFAVDKHGSTDDTPYGGGHGMVMRPGPVVDALEVRRAVGVDYEQVARGRIGSDAFDDDASQADARERVRGLAASVGLLDAAG